MIARFAFLLTLLLSTANLAAAGKTRNVILVTVDGLRWQEVFRGAESSLMNHTNGDVVYVDRLQAAFGHETEEARREALLPFFWGTVAKQGELYGNTTRGSVALVTNGRKFTYPGINSESPPRTEPIAKDEMDRPPFHRPRRRSLHPERPATPGRAQRRGR